MITNMPTIDFVKAHSTRNCDECGGGGDVWSRWPVPAWGICQQCAGTGYMTEDPPLRNRDEVAAWLAGLDDQ